VPPIDVLWVQKESASGQTRNYYFAFGGCHRYEAYKRLHKTHIPCKLIKVDEQVLATHTGFTLKEA
jgi:sulfiredoxin